jgi:hypothetical protein
VPVGFDRRVDAAISRPVSETKVGCSHRTHGVTATSKLRQASSCCGVERYVCFLRNPDSVEQDRKFPCELQPRPFFWPACYLELPDAAPPSKRKVQSFPCGRWIWFALDQQTSEI